MQVIEILENGEVVSSSACGPIAHIEFCTAWPEEWRGVWERDVSREVEKAWAEADDWQDRYNAIQHRLEDFQREVRIAISDMEMSAQLKARLKSAVGRYDDY